MSPIPLSFRVPNPPAFFAGRHRTLEVLERLWERSPLVVLQGPGGVGKTALASEAVMRSPERAALAVYGRISPGESLRELVVRLLHVFATAEGLEPDDWEEARQSQDLGLAALIDLADQGAWTVVVDDVHALSEPVEQERLLTLVGRYARRSRWVVTTRTQPPASLDLAAVLRVGPLDPEAMHQLAELWAPSAASTALAAAVREADGLPWKLRQILLAGSSDGHGDALAALALLERPLGRRTLAQAGIADAATLSALHHSGHVEFLDGRVVMHAMSRKQALWERDEAAQQALARRLVEQLSACGSDVARVEAFRLAVEHFPADEVPLEPLATTLLDDGHAPEVARLLRENPEVDGEGPVRLRAAAESGDLRLARRWLALGTGREAPEDPASAVALARLLYAANRFDDVLTMVAGHWQTPHESGVEALSLRGRALFHLGRLDDALALAETVKGPADSVRGFVAQELRCSALLALGRTGAAGRNAEALVAALPRLPEAWRRRGGPRVVRVLYQLGQLERAREVLDAVLAEFGESATALVSGRHALFSQGAIEVASGRLERAHDIFQRLQVFYDGDSPVWQAMLDVAQLTVALARGTAAAAQVARMQHVAVASSSAEVVCAAYHEQVLWALAQGLERPEAPEEIQQGQPLAQVARWRTRLHAARWGRGEEWRLEEGPVEVAAVAAQAEAARRLEAGRLREARAAIALSLRLARSEGYQLLEAQALRLALEVDACGEDRSLLAENAARLNALAVATGSPRLAGLARIYGLVDVASRDEVAAALLELAGQGYEAGRMARALLGLTPPLDLIERRVVARLGRWLGVGLLRWAGPEPEPSRAWRVDLAGARLQRPDGTAVGLGRRPQLWSLLQALLKRGEATKEECVILAWRTPEYHPLRHDNRLRLAARKLRMAIEASPTRPELLLTAEDGYRLGAPVLVVGGS